MDYFELPYMNFIVAKLVACFCLQITKEVLSMSVLLMSIVVTSF